MSYWPSQNDQSRVFTRPSQNDQGETFMCLNKMIIAFNTTAWTIHNKMNHIIWTEVACHHLGTEIQHMLKTWQSFFFFFFVLDWLLLWFQNTMKTVPFASKLLHHQRCPWSCDQDSQGCPDCCFKLGWHNPRQNAQLGVKGLKVNSDRFLSGSVV